MSALEPITLSISTTLNRYDVSTQDGRMAVRDNRASVPQAEHCACRSPSAFRERSLRQIRFARGTIEFSGQTGAESQPARSA